MGLDQIIVHWIWKNLERLSEGAKVGVIGYTGVALDLRGSWRLLWQLGMLHTGGSDDDGAVWAWKPTVIRA